MWIIVLTVTYYFAQKCLCLNLLDLPSMKPKEVTNLTNASDAEKPPQGNVNARRNLEPRYPPIRTTLPMQREGQLPKHWLRQSNGQEKQLLLDDEMKDIRIKNKIQALVQATLHDIERKLGTVKKIKDDNRNEAPYKIGFILSMIKKSRDVLNELFDVAIKHRDKWKALEQLKIFELIVHTNVDATNLVRQLVEIHIQHISSNSSPRDGKKLILI